MPQSQLPHRGRRSQLQLCARPTRGRARAAHAEVVEAGRGRDRVHDHRAHGDAAPRREASTEHNHSRTAAPMGADADGWTGSRSTRARQPTTSKAPADVVGAQAEDCAEGGTTCRSAADLIGPRRGPPRRRIIRPLVVSLKAGFPFVDVLLRGRLLLRPVLPGVKRGLAAAAGDHEDRHSHRSELCPHTTTTCPSLRNIRAAPDWGAAAHHAAVGTGAAVAPSSSSRCRTSAATPSAICTTDSPLSSRG